MTKSYNFDEIREKLDDMIDGVPYACCCMGPQEDEPECPCAMRSIIRWRGEWMRLTPLKPRPEVHLGQHAVMLSTYESKIHTIKVVRDITSLSLTDAKRLVESASERFPAMIKADISLEEAQNIEKAFGHVGAVVEIL